MIKPPRLNKLVQFMFAAFVAAIAGSFCGGLIISVVGAIVAPGDAGTVAALLSLPFFTMIIGLIAFLIGFPALLVLGIIITWPFVHFVVRNQGLASVVGIFLGLLFAYFTSEALGVAPDNSNMDMLWASLICGALFGYAWIQSVRAFVGTPSKAEACAE